MEYGYEPVDLKIRRIPYYAISFIRVLIAIRREKRLEFITGVVFNKQKSIYLKKMDLFFHIKTLLDILTLKEVVLDKEYERGGVRIEKKDKVIVDIGAGFGDFSIFAAKKNPDAKIYAFEPDRTYIPLLKENIKKNRVGNVRVNSEAVFSMEQIFRFIRPQSNRSKYGPNHFTQCDFMKIDCEGCEFQILSKESLKFLGSVKKISMEYHENDRFKVRTLVDLLRKEGRQVSFYPRRNSEGLGLLGSKAY